MNTLGLAARLAVYSAWIESRLAYRDIPSVAAAIVCDDKVVWSRGFGFADRERARPATTLTLYRVASNTKMFTAVAVMQLRDRGKIDLHAPVREYLPWFHIREESAENPVTVWHLLTHSSGLPREAAFPYWSDERFPSVDELRGPLPSQRAVLPPGTRWKYSNLGLALAGEIVEAAAGMPYSQYVRQHILEPLEMRHTSIDTIDPASELLAVGYSRRLPREARSPAPFSDGRGLTPAFNMTSNVDDLSHFVAMVLGGGSWGGRQILKPASMAEMLRPQWVEAGWRDGWGIGFYLEQEAGRIYAGHRGALRGYRSIVRMCPAERTGFIALVSSDDGESKVFAQRYSAMVEPALRSAPDRSDSPEPKRTAWERYEGRYRNGWEDYQVMSAEGRLLVIEPNGDDPLSTLMELEPQSDGTFLIDAVSGYGNHGERARFEVDQAGDAQSFIVGENRSERITAW